MRSVRRAAAVSAALSAAASPVKTGSVLAPSARSSASINRDDGGVAGSAGRRIGPSSSVAVGFSRSTIVVMRWTAERNASSSPASCADGPSSATPSTYGPAPAANTRASQSVSADGHSALQDERIGIDGSNLHGGELQQVDVPIDVWRCAGLDLADLVAGDLAVAALGNRPDELTPGLDVVVPLRERARARARLACFDPGRRRAGSADVRASARRSANAARSIDSLTISGAAGRSAGSGSASSAQVDRDSAQRGIRRQPARRRQQRERDDGHGEVRAHGHVEAEDRPEHFAHRRERGASEDALETSAESVKPEVVREALRRRQLHARRIGIDLPRMHGQRHRNAARIAILDDANHAGRRRHPQSPSEPSGMFWPNRRSTSGGNSITLPPAVDRACGCFGYAGSPTIRIGAMLESNVKPRRASVSSAHSERSLIDHSGAR